MYILITLCTIFRGPKSPDKKKILPTKTPTQNAAINNHQQPNVYNYQPVGVQGPSYPTPIGAPDQFVGQIHSPFKNYEDEMLPSASQFGGTQPGYAHSAAFFQR